MPVKEPGLITCDICELNSSPSTVFLALPPFEGTASSVTVAFKPLGFLPWSAVLSCGEF